MEKLDQEKLHQQQLENYKKDKKMSTKSKWLIGCGSCLGAFILLIVLLTACAVILDDDRSSGNNSTQSESKKSDEFDSKVETAIEEARNDTMKLIGNLNEDGTYSQKEAKKMNDEVFKRADKAEKDFKKDKNYSSVKKKFNDNNVSDDELVEFLKPYTQPIRNVPVQYQNENP